MKQQTYWHIQLHPPFSNIGEKEILQQTNLIGLGEGEENKRQIKQFSDEMKIGDIVLIKRGKLSIALVEVVGELEYNSTPNPALDWFECRRKIKILEILDEARHDFPQPSGTLSKAKNISTKTYQYINDWYNKIVQNTS
ncbi:MAG: restriction endonuclease, partial [Methylococcaceae bacterium]|nr:restriction endonuclease [Methylococcaceae bacterium]